MLDSNMDPITKAATPKTEGLLGKKPSGHPFNEYPKHLHHTSEAPPVGHLSAEQSELLKKSGYPGSITAMDRETEEVARMAGYTEVYAQAGSQDPSEATLRAEQEPEEDSVALQAEVDGLRQQLHIRRLKEERDYLRLQLSKPQEASDIQEGDTDNIASSLGISTGPVENVEGA